MSAQELAIESLSRQRYVELLPRLQELFAAAFGRSVPAGLLEWRYLHNPVGDILDLVARLPDDSLAASYSVAPVAMTFRGQALKSGISMTTMTAPDYAGRGLFTKLAAMLYEQMLARDYDLVWGFPNANSHPGFVSKLQWRDVYEIPTMSLDLEKVNVARLPADAREVRLDSGLELDYSGITRSGSDQLMVLRSRDYLRWRYANHPENDYSVYCVAGGEQVSSYCITKVYQASVIDIVDLIVASREEMLLLLGKVIDVARKSAIKRIDCWAPRHHFCHSVYEKVGFRLQAPITYLGVRMLSAKHAAWGDVCNYSNWYLQMGDSDVF